MGERGFVVPRVWGLNRYVSLSAASQNCGNGSYYMPMQEVEERWRCRRQGAVLQYLKGMQDEQLAGSVLDACARDLADLGVQVVL